MARKALAATGGGAGIGALAWWDGAPGWRKPVGYVAAECSGFGLDPASTLPASPDHVTAFGRAVDATRARVRETDHMVTDAGQGPKGERRVAIVPIKRNGRIEVNPAQSIVVCPRDGSAPYIEVDPTGHAATVITLERDYFDAYTSDDMRTAIVGMIDRWQGMSCRQQRPFVVYWIPGAALATIARLADFAVSIGWGRIELFEGRTDSPRAVQAVTNAVNGGLESMLTDYADRADKYMTQAADKTRPSTIEGMVTEAAALRDRWTLMRSILGTAVTSGEARIAKIEGALRSHLGVVEAAHA